MFNKPLLALSLLALTACGDAMTYPSQLEPEATAAAATASTPVDQITLTSQQTLNGGNYTVLGPIEATVGKVTAFHPSPTVAQAEQKLRIEAAELGADAVINVEIGEVTICPFSWGCRHASGTAVKLPR